MNSFANFAEEDAYDAIGRAAAEEADRVQSAPVAPLEYGPHGPLNQFQRRLPGGIARVVVVDSYSIRQHRDAGRKPTNVAVCFVFRADDLPDKYGDHPGSFLSNARVEFHGPVELGQHFDRPVRGICGNNDAPVYLETSGPLTVTFTDQESIDLYRDALRRQQAFE